MSKTIAFVGRSGSGKTTVIEKLVAVLKERGHSVATIKHSHHELPPDKVQSDTDKHRQAGSDTTVLVAPNGSIIRSSVEIPVDSLVELLSKEHDYLIVEGFKASKLRKVEVVGHREPLLAESEVWLTLSANSLGRAHELQRDNIGGLADKLALL